MPPKYIYRDATTCAQYAATLASWRCQRGRPGGRRTHHLGDGLPMGRDDRAGARPRDAGHVPFGVPYGQLSTIKIGRRTFVAASELDAYIERRSERRSV